MSKSMKIMVSEPDRNTPEFASFVGQRVGFINVLNSDGQPTSGIVSKPKKILYDDENVDTMVCLIDYYPWTSGSRTYSIEQGYTPLRSGSINSASSVFKQEIDDDGNALTRFYPVDTEIVNFKFRDFNVSNNRRYRYVLYPFDMSGDATSSSIEKAVTETPIITNWQGWSITELHPVSGNAKKFTASADDVWVFNLNVDTGEQSQNISRQEQQTLGQFNRYSQGKLNYISGSVNCLLGSDVLPASYIIKNGKTINEGGYQEIRKTDKNPTSNERVDMLLAWRKLVMSSNPKLLKDRAGQSFLVTISNSTNKPMDAVYRQPNTISFTWTQIGTTEDVEIVGSSI